MGFGYLAQLEFWVSVNPIPIRGRAGADYDRRIIACPQGFGNLALSLKWEWKLYIVVMVAYCSNKYVELLVISLSSLAMKCQDL